MGREDETTPPTRESGPAKPGAASAPPRPVSSASPAPQRDFGQTMVTASDATRDWGAGVTADSKMTMDSGAASESGASDVRRMPDRGNDRSVQAGTMSSQPFLPTAPGALPQIEGYEVLKKVGEGGMGMVFDARQLATGRRVAIKILPESILNSQTARRRFEREVEVVASLQHPGIVPVIDSGVRRGNYYYVMDYVEGKPLDDVFVPGTCDLRAGLEALASICDSVDYAHQRGVLHRDLKPSNVLVDAKGVTHLLDFGLAKQTGSDATPAPSATPQNRLVTVAGEGAIFGTIAYMSPEQASGHADEASVRTDVYSLGVIGYQLVTGELPVSMQGSLRDVLTWIAEKEPSAPSVMLRSRSQALTKGTGSDAVTVSPSQRVHHSRRVGRDLDAVLLKALEKSPDKRYATAGALAADIRRYLASEPVEARHVGAGGRLIRWVKRNKTLATTIAGAAAALVVVSTLLVTRIVAERDRALVSERVAQQNAATAKQSFDFVREIWLAADNKEEITLRDMIERAVARLDRNKPESVEADIELRGMIGQVYTRLGAWDKAYAQLRRVYDYRSQHDPGFDDKSRADAVHQLGAALWWMGNYTDALPLYEQSLAIRRRLFQGDHPDIAVSLTHLAATKLRLGQRDEAGKLYQDALDMRIRLFGSEHEQVAPALNNLAKYYMEIDRDDLAEPLFRRALAMILKIRGEKDPGVAAASQNLGYFLLEKGDPRAAREAFDRAFTIRQTSWPNGHPSTGMSLVGLAKADLALGDLAQAREHASAADKMYKVLKYTQRDRADAIGTLGRVALREGEVVEARKLLEESRSIWNTGNPPANIELAEVEGDLGEVLLALGEREQGVAMLASAHQRLISERGQGSKLAQAALERLRKLAGKSTP